MNENDEFTHVQRRLCAVIAKSEWTSSRMRMQKSGEELRESRAKSNRTANQFLQDLLEKRTDGESIDDNGAVDRYHKFVKYKSKRDDSTDTLDEFERRLRALNANRQNQKTKTSRLNNENSIQIPESKLHLQINPQFQIDEKDVLKPVSNTDKPKSSRNLPNVSSNPITSTPNDTTHELMPSVFPEDEIQEFSHVHSENQSLDESQLTNPIPQSQTVSLERNETINSSTSSLNQSFSQILHTPKARRLDGTEYLPKSIRTSPSHAPSDVPLFHRCHFPRSLTSRAKLNSSPSSLKRQLPTLPAVVVQLNETKQFYPEKIYDLLDHLEENFQENFTKKLDGLILTNVSSRLENETTTIRIEECEQMDEDEENESVLPNPFSQTVPIEQEKRFYTTLQLTVDQNCQNLLLYTMTFSTVQLTSSLRLPYSILNGRRPVLKCSNQTSFKRIPSKQSNSTSQITAIEYSSNIPEIQQNDIILKINDQSVGGLPIDAISDLLKRSSSCSLTLVRLCQPLL